MGFVGCYRLDLYCDGPKHPWQPGVPIFTGRTFSECARRAEAAGWLIDPKGTGRECGRALCPKCRPPKRKPRAAKPPRVVDEQSRGYMNLILRRV
jgi:hypothetical protein